ncbi:MAG TPA: glycosyltransferase family 39 protein [Phycisphaerae bacterium]|nr:glycosyltransferase family 39 protein [Phycisphaerae bacterium]
MIEKSQEKLHRVRRLWLSVGLATAVVVAIGLLWRTIRYAMGFPIWGDEAFIVTSLCTRDFGGMIRPLEYGQIAPLGFMWIELAVVRAAGLSEYALRLVPFLTGLASMLLFWRFATRIFDRWSALLAVAVFAASYYPVRHAAEVKPYASDLLVSLILTYLGWAVMTSPRSAWRWGALIVFGAVSVWVSYPAAFVGGAVGACLLYRTIRARAWGSLVPVAIYCVFLANSFYMMYEIYGRPTAGTAEPMKDTGTWKESFPPLNEPSKLPWWLLKTHTGNMLAYPVGGKNFGSSATFVLVIAGSVALLRSRRGRLLLLLLGPLVLALVAAAMRQYPYGGSARTELYMAPAFCLLAGLGLAAMLRLLVRRAHVPSAFRIAAAVLAVVAVAGAANDIREPYKKRAALRNRQVVQALGRTDKDGDQWVIFLALPETSCDQRVPDVRQFKGSAATFRYNVRRYLPQQRVRWAARPDKLTPGATGRIFFIIYRDNDIPFSEADKTNLAAYLGELEARFGKPVMWESHILTSSEDPGRSQLEQVEVYQFAQGR